MAADLMEFAGPKIAEVVIGRKSFKRAEKSVGRQVLKKHLAVAIIRGKSFEQKLADKPLCH